MGRTQQRGRNGNDLSPCPHGEFCRVKDQECRSCRRSFPWGAARGGAPCQRGGAQPLRVSGSSILCRRPASRRFGRHTFILVNLPFLARPGARARRAGWRGAVAGAPVVALIGGGLSQSVGRGRGAGGALLVAANGAPRSWEGGVGLLQRLWRKWTSSRWRRAAARGVVTAGAWLRERPPSWRARPEGRGRCHRPGDTRSGGGLRSEQGRGEQAGCLQLLGLRDFTCFPVGLSGDVYWWKRCLIALDPEGARWSWCFRWCFLRVPFASTPGSSASESPEPAVECLLCAKHVAPV